MILAFPYRALADLRREYAQARAAFDAAKHGTAGDKFDELSYEVAEKWLAI